MCSAIHLLPKGKCNIRRLKAENKNYASHLSFPISHSIGKKQVLIRLLLYFVPFLVQTKIFLTHFWFKFLLFTFSFFSCGPRKTPEAGKKAGKSRKKAQKKQKKLFFLLRKKLARDMHYLLAQIKTSTENN